MGTGLGHLSLGLFRGPVSENGVDPPPVIVAFDIREQLAVGILAGRPSLLVRDPTTDFLAVRYVRMEMKGGAVVSPSP